jgi:hypothetical protein
MSSTDLYDTDFYDWTLSQAEALREAGRRRGASNAVDWERVAEEIEDMGKSDLRECLSRTRTILEHLYKLTAGGRDEPKPGWRTAVKTQRADLKLVLTSSLRGHVATALPKLHEEAADIARTAIEAEEPGAVVDAALSWSFPEILGERNDPLG